MEFLKNFIHSLLKTFEIPINEITVFFMGLNVFIIFLIILFFCLFWVIVIERNDEDLDL